MNHDVIVESLEPRLLYSADLLASAGAVDDPVHLHGLDLLSSPVVAQQFDPLAAGADDSVDFAVDGPVDSAASDPGYSAGNQASIPLDKIAAIDLETSLALAELPIHDSVSDLDLQTVLRTVKGINDPTVIVGHATVIEGEYVQITSTLLQAVDSDSGPEDLTFTIVNIDHGQFEHIANAGVPITSFTQQQIDTLQIRLLHDGSESTTVSIDYVLVDELGVVPVPGVAIVDVNSANDAPLAEDDFYSVNEGGALDTAVNFPLHTSNMAVDSPRALHAADLDRDGDSDLVLAEFNTGAVWWGQSDGNGEMTRHALTTEHGKPLYVNSADVDQDGDIDILATFIGQINNAVWYENDGSQNFTSRPISAATGQMLKAADIDGDGDIDLAMAANSSLLWFENDGSQNFVQHQVQGGVTDVTSIEIADLDGDRDMDLVVPLTGDDRVVWYENTGAHSFSQRMIGGLDEPETIGVADVNNDGFLDVLSVTTETPSAMRWYINDGTQSFSTSDTPVTVDFLYSNTGSEVVDLDADGDADVLLASATNDNIWLYENDGSGVFSAVLIDNTANFGATVTAADMDADGDLDVVTAQWNGVSAVRWFESVHSVLQNDTDAEGDDLSAVITSTPAHGIVTFQADGDFVYTHDGSDISGADSFTYQAIDAAGLQSQATVNINVRAVNDAPVLLVNGDMTIQEGDVGQIIGSGNLSTVDSDDTSGDVVYQISALPSNGVLRLDGVPLLLGSSFTQLDVDSSRLSYDHDGSETVGDSFIFDVSDGGEDGAAALTGQVFSIQVTPVNDPPVFENFAGSNLIYPVGSAPAIIDQDSDALISDVDSFTYSGATLTGLFAFGGATPGSELGIRNEGDGDSQISVNGAALSYGGQQIGTVSSGPELNVTFNENANVESVSAAIRNITFQETGPDTSSRILSFLLTDAGGAVAQTNAYVVFNPVPEVSPLAISLIEDGSSTGWVISITDVSAYPNNYDDGNIRVTRLPDNATLFSDTSFTNPVTLDSVIPLPGFQPFGLPSSVTLLWSLLPDPDWVGSTSFELTVTDNEGGVTVSTVPVRVDLEFNDPPVRIAGDVLDIEVPEDSGFTPLWSESLQYSPGGGVDESGQNLMVEVTDVPDPAIANIVLADNTTVVTAGSIYTLTQLNGMRLATLPDVYGGPETFGFTVTDDGTSFGVPSPLSISESLLINILPVNDPPALTANHFPITEGGVLILSPVEFAVVDIDTQSDPAISLTADYLASYPATFTYDDVVQGNVQLVHDGSENQPEIQITLVDEAGASNTVEAAVTFNPVNDPPRNLGTLPSTIGALEDIALTVDVSSLFLHDTDAYGANVSLTVSTSGGTLIVDDSSNITVIDNNTSTTTITGSVASINAWAATESALSYRGSQNAYGAERISFVVNDNGNNGAGGGGDVDLGSIDINIASVNDSPSGADGHIEIVEDSSFFFQAKDFGFTDPDNNAFAGIVVTGIPSGVLTLNSVPVNQGQFLAAHDIENGSLIFSAASHSVGEDRIEFQVVDDGGTLNSGADRNLTPNQIVISIVPVNDAPVGADTTIHIVEDRLYRFTGDEFGFIDQYDGHQLETVIVETLPSRGQLLLDGVIVSAGQQVGAEEISTGRLAYRAAAGESGTVYDAMYFRVRDNGGTAHGGVDTNPHTNRITFNVSQVSDAPVAIDSNYAGVEDIDSVLRVEDFAYIDSADHPPDVISSIVVDTLPARGLLLLNGQVVIAGDSISAVEISQGRLMYRTDANAHGMSYDTLGFTVIDSGQTENGGENASAVPATLTFDIVGVNDPPAATDSSVTIGEDTPHTFTRPEFGFTDLIDGHSMSGIQIVVLPETGKMTVAGNEVIAGDIIAVNQIDRGALVFTPFPNVTGVYSGLGFAVIDDGGDGSGGVDTAPTINYISFDLPNTNDAPLLMAGQVLVDEGSESRLTILELSASDPDNQPDELTFTIDTTPAYGVVTLAGIALPVGSVFTLDDVIRGDIGYVHDGSESASDTIGITLSDGGMDGSAPVSGQLVVAINEVVDPAPILSGDSLSVSYGQSFSSYSGDLTDSGVNRLGQQALQNLTGLAITLERAPAYGNIELEADGTFTYTHNGSIVLLDEFAYRVTNEDGMYSIATVRIEIEPPLAPAFEGASPSLPKPHLDTAGWEGAGTAQTATGLTHLMPVIQPDPGSRELNQYGVSASVSSVVAGDTRLMGQKTVPTVAEAEVLDEQRGDSMSPGSASKSAANVPVNGWNSPVYGTPEHSDVSRRVTALDVIQHNEQVVNEAQWNELVVTEYVDIASLELSIRMPVESTRPVEFLNGLQQLADDVEEWTNEEHRQSIVVTDSMLAVSSGITVGVFASMFRGGSLAASILATAPLWTGLDPIGYAIKVDRQQRIDKELTDADMKVEALFR